MDWAWDCRVLRSASASCELLYWDMPRGALNSRAQACAPRPHVCECV